MNARFAADAGLHLLDRQILDKDGKLAGNVDDLELTVPDEGGPPFISAILCGPEALGRRINGPLGRWMQAAQARLRPSDQEGPARIPFGVVKRIVQHVELGVSADDLAVTQLERWVQEHIIGRIPGAERAAE
jgi:sporulation protein YlmC with PRC-barrel domain